MWLVRGLQLQPVILDRCLDDEVAGPGGQARVPFDAPAVGVVKAGDAEARWPPQGFVALRMESKAQRILLPARFGERDRREVDAFDETGLLWERSFSAAASRSSPSRLTRQFLTTVRMAVRTLLFRRRRFSDWRMRFTADL